jgi:hypothetical protein
MNRLTTGNWPEGDHRTKYTAHEIRRGFSSSSFRARPQAATRSPLLRPWIPAFAGMTGCDERSIQENPCDRTRHGITARGTKQVWCEHVDGSNARYGFRARWRRWLLMLVCLQYFFIPTGASAVMPPWVYQKARDTAMFHAQVKVLHVTGPARTPGECVVTGEVVRIFRNTPGTLRPKAALHFTVSCSKPGDPMIVGGTLWKDYNRLMKAKYLEVFLNSEGGNYEVALWQSRIIAAPTERPTFPPSEATGK